LSRSWRGEGGMLGEEKPSLLQTRVAEKSVKKGLNLLNL